MVPQQPLMEEDPPVLDGATHCQQDDSANADQPVLHNDVSRLSRGGWHQNVRIPYKEQVRGSKYCFCVNPCFTLTHSQSQYFVGSCQTSFSKLKVKLTWKLDPLSFSRWILSQYVRLGKFY